MQSNLQAALSYEKHGFSVIPIRPDKKPYIPWTEFQKRRATPEEITSWFTKWSSAMIGICTGEISGVLVVDCDSEEAYQKIQEILPEGFLTAIAKTPRGYHIYLIYPKGQNIGNAAGIMPGVDIRGEGGYIIAPGSVNAEGKAYQWMDKLSIDEIEPATVPNILNKYINIYKRANADSHTKSQIVTQSHIFEHGKRDDNLYHIGLCLAKMGNSEDYIRQTLTAIMSSWGECDETWINTKLQSIAKRISTNERNIAEEVRKFLEVTEGHFLVTDCHTESQIVTKEDKHAVIVELRRLCKAGVIEPYGNRRGCYRKVDNEIEFMDFSGVDLENYIPLRLPLGIHTKTKLFPKGAIIVAGVSGMGKTLFCLNAIAQNIGKFPIYYFNSEMGPEALKMKLSYFPIPIDQWVQHMKVIDQWDFNNIADKIQPDAFNVVDYLEPEGEKAFNIHGVISAIIRRLSKGAALISIQKKPGATLGTGGIYSIKAATLALALDWGKIEIVKNRFREADPLPSLNKINFEVHQGHKFVKVGNWYK